MEGLLEYERWNHEGGLPFLEGRYVGPQTEYARAHMHFAGLYSLMFNSSQHLKKLIDEVVAQ